MLSETAETVSFGQELGVRVVRSRGEIQMRLAQMKGRNPGVHPYKNQETMHCECAWHALSAVTILALFLFVTNVTHVTLWSRYLCHSQATTCHNRPLFLALSQHCPLIRSQFLSISLRISISSPVNISNWICRTAEPQLIPSVSLHGMAQIKRSGWSLRPSQSTIPARTL